jgi:menaquinone-dependent protoporphyrinogen IX oxidase
VESLEQEKYFDYFKIYSLYNSLVFNHIENLMTEIREIHIYTEENKHRKNRDKKKEKEWISDIKKQVNQNKERSKKLTTKFRKSMPKSWFGRMVIKLITKYIGKKYQRKIKNVLT